MVTQLTRTYDQQQQYVRHDITYAEVVRSTHTVDRWKAMLIYALIKIIQLTNQSNLVENGYSLPRLSLYTYKIILQILQSNPKEENLCLTFLLERTIYSAIAQ